MEVINRKENMEVATICFEVRVPMENKQKYLWNNYLDLDSTILFWKKTKIFMETLLYCEKATEK